MDEERRRRIAAARGYAGLSRGALGKKMDGVSEDTVKRWEDGTNKRPLKAHEEEALLRNVADACGLPENFFYIDFAANAGGAAEERMAALEDLYLELVNKLGFDDQSALVSQLRRRKRSYEGLLADGESATGAPGSSRDEGGATPGSAPTPGEATPRSGESTVG